MMNHPLAVINPGGKDPDQSFSQGAGQSERGLHAPINYHAYAACTKGAFLCSLPKAYEWEGPILLLLRKNLSASEKALDNLLAANRKVIVTWKEAGIHQISPWLRRPWVKKRFQRILAKSHAALASTQQLVELFKTYLPPEAQTILHFIPTPYPIEQEAWNFSKPLEQRRGIFVGTREFSVPSRRHALALQTAATIAQQTGHPITVLNTEGRRGRTALSHLDIDPSLLQVVEGPLPYEKYLELMSSHRIVWQCDESTVPGQVAGDALLCRMPSFGGRGTVEKIAFEDTTTPYLPERQVMAARALREDPYYRALLQKSKDKARTHLSFRAIAPKLQNLFAEIDAAAL